MDQEKPTRHQSGTWVEVSPIQSFDPFLMCVYLSFLISSHMDDGEAPLENLIGFVEGRKNKI